MEESLMQAVRAVYKTLHIMSVQIAELMLPLRQAARQSFNTDTVYFLDGPVPEHLGFRLDITGQDHPMREACSRLEQSSLYLQVKLAMEAVDARSAALQGLIDAFVRKELNLQVGLVSSEIKSRAPSSAEKLRLLEINSFLAQQSRLKLSIYFLSTARALLSLYPLAWYLREIHFSPADLNLSDPVFEGFAPEHKEQIALMAALFSSDGQSRQLQARSLKGQADRPVSNSSTSHGSQAGAAVEGDDGLSSVFSPLDFGHDACDRLELIARLIRCLCTLRDGGILYGFALAGLDNVIQALYSLARVSPELSIAQLVESLGVHFANHPVPAIVRLNALVNSPAWARTRLKAASGSAMGAGGGILSGPAAPLSRVIMYKKDRHLAAFITPADLFGTGGSLSIENAAGQGHDASSGLDSIQPAAASLTSGLELTPAAGPSLTSGLDVTPAAPAAPASTAQPARAAGGFEITPTAPAAQSQPARKAGGKDNEPAAPAAPASQSQPARKADAKGNEPAAPAAPASQSHPARKAGGKDNAPASAAAQSQQAKEHGLLDITPAVPAKNEAHSAQTGEAAGRAVPQSEKSRSDRVSGSDSASGSIKSFSMSASSAVSEGLLDLAPADNGAAGGLSITPTAGNNVSYGLSVTPAAEQGQSGKQGAVIDDRHEEKDQPESPAAAEKKQAGKAKQKKNAAAAAAASAAAENAENEFESHCTQARPAGHGRGAKGDHNEGDGSGSQRSGRSAGRGAKGDQNESDGSGSQRNGRSAGRRREHRDSDSDSGQRDHRSKGRGRGRNDRRPDLTLGVEGKYAFLKDEDADDQSFTARARAHFDSVADRYLKKQEDGQDSGRRVFRGSLDDNTPEAAPQAESSDWVPKSNLFDDEMPAAARRRKARTTVRKLLAASTDSSDRHNQGSNTSLNMSAAADENSIAPAAPASGATAPSTQPEVLDINPATDAEQKAAQAHSPLFIDAGGLMVTPAAQSTVADSESLSSSRAGNATVSGLNLIASCVQDVGSAVSAAAQFRSRTEAIAVPASPESGGVAGLGVSPAAPATQEAGRVGGLEVTPAASAVPKGDAQNETGLSDQSQPYQDSMLENEDLTDNSEPSVQLEPLSLDAADCGENNDDLASACEDVVSAVDAGNAQDLADKSSPVEIEADHSSHKDPVPVPAAAPAVPGLVNAAQSALNAQDMNFTAQTSDFEIMPAVSQDSLSLSSLSGSSAPLLATTGLNLFGSQEGSLSAVSTFDPVPLTARPAVLSGATTVTTVQPELKPVTAAVDDLQADSSNLSSQSEPQSYAMSAGSERPSAPAPADDDADADDVDSTHNTEESDIFLDAYGEETSADYDDLDSADYESGSECDSDQYIDDDSADFDEDVDTEGIDEDSDEAEDAEIADLTMAVADADHESGEPELDETVAPWKDDSAASDEVDEADESGDHAAESCEDDEAGDHVAESCEDDEAGDHVAESCGSDEAGDHAAESCGSDEAGDHAAESRGSDEAEDSVAESRGSDEAEVPVDASRGSDEAEVPVDASHDSDDEMSGGHETGVCEDCSEASGEYADGSDEANDASDDQDDESDDFDDDHESDDSADSEEDADSDYDDEDDSWDEDEDEELSEEELSDDESLEFESESYDETEALSQGASGDTASIDQADDEPEGGVLVASVNGGNEPPVSKEKKVESFDKFNWTTRKLKASEVIDPDSTAARSAPRMSSDDAMGPAAAVAADSGASDHIEGSFDAITGTFIPAQKAPQPPAAPGAVNSDIQAGHGASDVQPLASEHYGSAAAERMDAAAAAAPSTPAAGSAVAAGTAKDAGAAPAVKHTSDLNWDMVMDCDPELLRFKYCMLQAQSYLLSQAEYNRLMESRSDRNDGSAAGSDGTGVRPLWADIGRCTLMQVCGSAEHLDAVKNAMVAGLSSNAADQQQLGRSMARFSYYGRVLGSVWNITANAESSPYTPQQGASLFDLRGSAPVQFVLASLLLAASAVFSQANSSLMRTAWQRSGQKPPV